MVRMAAAKVTTKTDAVAADRHLAAIPHHPGVSPTKVALAVVLVLGKALQTALSGPVPNPIAIPIYMVLLAAYQRLTEIALNHVPVAGTPHHTPAVADWHRRRRQSGRRPIRTVIH